MRRVSGLATAWFLLFGFLLARAAEPVVVDIPIQPASYGTAFFQETADLAAKSSPGYAVRISGDPRIHDKVRIRVMAGDEPDATDAVLQYDALVAAGRLVDLTPYLDGPNWEGTGRWRDDFLPGVLERWKRGKAVYGLPFAYAAWVLFYNQGLFEQNGWEPPHTWDDYLALCEKMKAKGIVPLTLPGIYMRYADAFFRGAFYDLAGPEGYAAYQQLDANVFVDPRFLRAADITQKATYPQLLKGWLGMSHTASQQAFLEGKAAMTLSGSWFVSEMKGKIPADFRLGACNIPTFNATEMGPVQGQGAYYFLFKKDDPKRVEATVNFFRFLTSRERAKAFVRTMQSPVALRCIEPSDFSSPPMRTVAALIRDAKSRFDSAPATTPAFLSFTAEGLNGGRWMLLNGLYPASGFAVHLGQAAAAERERMRDPFAVGLKHGAEAAVWLLVMMALLLWLVWKRKRPAPSPVSPGRRVSLPVVLGFTLPALLLFVAFVVVPAANSFHWAFFQWDGFNPRRWSGIFNFEWLLLESDAFWFAIKNNLFIMVVPTLFVVPVSLFLATMVQRGVWGGNVFRAVVLFPNLLGGIAATLLWMNAYAPHGGLVNAALEGLGNLTGSNWLKSFSGYAWLSQANLYSSLVPIYLWMATGFNMVLYLAAMQGIEPELYEAAELDGISPLRQFFSLTLPLIWEVLVVSAVFIVVASLNTFEMIWLLTSQDPGTRSHVLSTMMVSSMFTEFQIGRATAIAVVMFVMIAVASLAVLKLLQKKEEPA